MQLNSENLAVHMDTQKPSTINSLSEDSWQQLTFAQTPNKPLLKTEALGEAILDVFPDILVMCEVMGEDSALNFNEYFLSSEYSVLYNNTNSKRGIDLAFFVKKELPYEYKLISHKKRKIFLPDGSVQGFSRDIAELQVFEPQGVIPKIIILSVHLKSQISTENDHWGINVRRAEVESLVHYYKKLQKQYPNSHIILTGDFNGWAGAMNPSFEFQPIYEHTDLKDIHDLKQTQEEDRASHVHFCQDIPKCQQLDYIFLSPSLQSKVDVDGTYCYRYKFFGYPWPIAKNMRDKKGLPSDHYPQVVSFKLD